jgi:phospholipid/cholesterol/gamma-HCH transport system substrate-binding protein
VIKDTKTLAAQLKPVAKQLGDVLVDFQREDGIQRFLDYIFFQGTAVNGFDSFGHYLRAGLIVNQCTTYATQPTGGCSANFRPAASSSAVAAGAAGAPLDPALEWMRRFFDGEDVDPVRVAAEEKGDDRSSDGDGDGGGARGGDDAGGGGKSGGGKSGGGQTPEATPTPRPAPVVVVTPTPEPSAPAPTATPAPAVTPAPADPGDDPGEPLLDYLFGGDR